MSTQIIPTSYGAVLLDVEGTTTSIVFVKEVLFPYAASNVEHFLVSNFASKPDAANLSEVVSDLVQLSNEQVRYDNRVEMVNTHQLQSASASGDLAAVAEIMRTLSRNVHLWISQDKKHTALKSLQGEIWRHGYLNGQLKGHVFPDVPEALRNWHENGVPVYIFSSGSVQAQKLLFAHTTLGDLGWCLSGHFDTTTGSKGDGRSYEKIAAALRLSPREILFITDVENEAWAANGAGYQVVLSVREGNAPLSAKAVANFPQIRSFIDFFSGGF